MSRRIYTRRRLLSTVAAGVIGLQSIPQTAAKAGSSPGIQRVSQGAPTELLNSPIGWATGTADATGITIEQTADSQANRATIDTVAPVECSGTFTQMALVGGQFSVGDCQSATVSVSITGAIAGVAQAGKASPTEVTVRYGVGPRDDIRAALMSLETAAAFEAVATERTFQKLHVTDSTLRVVSEQMELPLSSSVSCETPQLAYVRLVVSGTVDATNTVGIDFGPSDPTLSTETTGLTLDSVTLTVEN